ncbi:MAG: hypothetical protein H8E76_06585 [Helicobacteraceae bacterium]|nr:hypothetical protein [Candidatus Sulfurimonas ponti]MBL6973227.1 hypothetical protein [Sulfurimonas sp.]
MNVEKSVKEKRSKLFVFASVSLVILMLSFFYLEIYDPYDVPNFVRVLLGLFWLYSVVAIYVAKRGSDKLVSKICLNIFRECRVGE